MGLQSLEDRRGMSLRPALRGDSLPHKREYVFSETHTVGNTSMFALRSERYKYIEIPGKQRRLFDLENDPQEFDDLLKNRPTDRAVQDISAYFADKLHGICDPAAVNEQRKAERG
ncbi:MAG: hypothetical protein GF401_07915 [Chitinivibrionales bacterium]|nr:hypothetical protein [Chitinivibrionales bacterium]